MKKPEEPMFIVVILDLKVNALQLHSRSIRRMSSGTWKEAETHGRSV